MLILITGPYCEQLKLVSDFKYNLPRQHPSIWYSRKFPFIKHCVSVKAEVDRDIIHLENLVFCSCTLFPARNLSECTLDELRNIDNRMVLFPSKFQGFMERPNETQKDLWRNKAFIQYIEVAVRLAIVRRRKI